MVCHFPKRLGSPRHLQPCSATYSSAFSSCRLGSFTLPRCRGRLEAICWYCASLISMHRSISQNHDLVLTRPRADWNGSISSQEYVQAARVSINPQSCSYMRKANNAIQVFNNCPIAFRVVEYQLQNLQTGQIVRSPCESEACVIQPGLYSASWEAPGFVTVGATALWEGAESGGPGLLPGAILNFGQRNQVTAGAAGLALSETWMGTRLGRPGNR